MKGIVNLGEYIKTIDWAALAPIDLTAFGTGLREGETIELNGLIEPPLTFDARGLIDHTGLKRGAPMTVEFDDGRPGISGVVTGRYRQRDGTVHAWGVITP